MKLYRPTEQEGNNKGEINNIKLSVYKYSRENREGLGHVQAPVIGSSINPPGFPRKIDKFSELREFDAIKILKSIPCKN